MREEGERKQNESAPLLPKKKMRPKGGRNLGQRTMGENELEGNQIIDGRREEDLPLIIFHYAIFINQGKNERKMIRYLTPKQITVILMTENDLILLFILSRMTFSCFPDL